MSRFLKLLALACCAIASGVSADPGLDKGKLLVATDGVSGGAFAESVVLLLHHDESGALGLVVNRPTEAVPEEALPELEGLAGYQGALFWGGPVQMYTMRALLRTDSPPDNTIHIVDAVYLAHADEALLKSASNASVLRFYIGYAGWAPGQLEHELARGSWHVVTATEEHVFAENPDEVWQTLLPPREYRAANDITESGAKDIKKAGTEESRLKQSGDLRLAGQVNDNFICLETAADARMSKDFHGLL